MSGQDWAARLGVGVMVSIAAAALVACGTGEQEKRAYEACLGAAKGAGSRIAAASFASFESSKIAGSTGEEEIRVSIPYELAGQKALYQCIAQRQRDGTFKVVF